jgi:hypothetical protein
MELVQRAGVDIDPSIHVPGTNASACLISMIKLSTQFMITAVRTSMGV